MLRQMMEVFEKYKSPVVALMEVPRENISAYGVVAGDVVAGLFGWRTLVQDQRHGGEAESRRRAFELAIIGRYILTPDIFHAIETITPGAGGELQLTDAIKSLLKSRAVYGYVFEGTRYDAGDKQGFLRATVDFALKREDLGPTSARS